MVTILSTITFLIIRSYYKDIYKIVFYISIPFVVLMLLIVASGDLTAAEELGNVVFLFFILLNIEVVLSRFIDKPVTKKKKRTDVKTGTKR